MTISALRARALLAIKNNGPWVSVGLVGNDGGIRALPPDFKLVDSRRPEGICGGQNEFSGPSSGSIGPAWR